ncbi:MAG: lysophospholipid acyltransferase family protein [Candidatus Edwardsbacteria bacterium]
MKFLGQGYYRLTWYVENWLLKFLFGLKIKGRQKIPEKGGVIIVSNHLSYLDPPLLGAAVNREIYFLAKEELFKHNRIFTWLLTAFNAIPLKRGGGNKKAIKTALEVLKTDRILAIFPEGTRSKTGKLLPMKSGAAWLASLTKVPILPVYIKGSNKSLLSLFLHQEKLEVTFGNLIFGGKKDHLQIITAIEREIRLLA